MAEIIPEFKNNTLVVKGSLKDLKAFKAKAQGMDYVEDLYHDICFHKFMPIPQKLKALKDIRKWQAETWGCPKGVIKSNVTFYSYAKELIYTFLTIESPLKALIDVSKAHPELSFEYFYKSKLDGIEEEYLLNNGIYINFSNNFLKSSGLLNLVYELDQTSIKDNLNLKFEIDSRDFIKEAFLERFLRNENLPNILEKYAKNVECNTSIKYALKYINERRLCCYLTQAKGILNE